MLNYIWIFLLLIGIVYSFITGGVDSLNTSLFNSIDEGVKLSIGLIGIICFWSGMMEVAKKIGLMESLAKGISPLLNRLFNNLPQDSQVHGSIVMNLSANCLGLGNAATPLGLKAIKDLNKYNPNPKTITDDMVMFLLLNNTILQLVPTTILALRGTYHSTNPSSVIPIIWIVSIISMTFGIILVKIVQASRRKK